MLELAGEENLDGKVLIDIAKPARLLAREAAFPLRLQHRLARRADPAPLSPTHASSRRSTR